MKTSILKKVYVILTIGSVLSGCLNAQVNKVESDVQDVRVGPGELPKRNITDFSAGLRCMDDLFLAFGASPEDYPVLVENINDKTKKVNAGTRQMIISAISDMTKRSRAVKLVVFGQDTGNLVLFLSETGNTNAYQSIPAFDIIGSISQLDDAVAKNQADSSAEVGGSWNGRELGGGYGASASNSATYLALDLGILTTHNMAVLAGVSTRNSVIIYTKGSSKSFDAGISKTGVTYSISSSRKDPMAQGLRALVELSTIELVGKLAKLPYWHCLGIDPNHEEIRNEVSDWYFKLKQSNLFHTSMKAQLYLRGYYKGDIDESINREYLEAVIRYKDRLGLKLTAAIDLDFYSAFLNQTPTTIRRSQIAFIKNNRHGLYDVGRPEIVSRINVHHLDDEDVGDVSSGDVQTQANVEITLNEVPEKEEVVDEELAIEIVNISGKQNYALGQKVDLRIHSSVNGYVTCYFFNGDVFYKLFPNRFSTNNFVSSQGMIRIPDNERYAIIAENNSEELHCYLTKKDLEIDLPGSINVTDFSTLREKNLKNLDAAFEAASLGRYAKASYKIKVNKNVE